MPIKFFSVDQPPIITQSERLIVRLSTERDVPTLASMWCDAQVTRFMGGPRVFEQVCTSLREELDSPPSRLDLWTVTERQSGTVIGHCGLLPKTVEGRDEVELNYIIAAAFWGRGYATEAASAIKTYALNSLRIPRLVSLIHPENTASERVALKLGMKFETETIRPNGKKLKVYATHTHG
jgi:[ribosomal protein S5]-alanine N-acetyltransferase